MSKFAVNFNVMKYQFTTSGTCSSLIDIEVIDGRIVDVKFTGGCNGNLKGLSALVKGCKPADVVERLEGIECGTKGTSCPDQLAKALKQLR